MEEDIDETQIDEERPITAWHDLKEYSSEDKKSVELLCFYIGIRQIGEHTYQ